MNSLALCANQVGELGRLLLNTTITVMSSSNIPHALSPQRWLEEILISKSKCSGENSFKINLVLIR